MSAPTAAQIETLLNFLEEHRELALGRLRSVEGRLQSQRLWKDISDTLNAMEGSLKTVQQWQRVWTDKKYFAKKAAAALRRAATATGGGPSTAAPLSQWDIRIISIMKEGFGERDTTAKVPAFPESPEGPSSQPVSVYTASSQSTKTVGSVTDLTPQIEEETDQPAQQQASASRPSFSRRSSRWRSRRMRSTADDSVRSRLFHIEEQRNIELSGIRAALQQNNVELTGIRAALLQLCEIIRNNNNGF